jgi:hypothetical protein
MKNIFSFAALFLILLFNINTIAQTKPSNDSLWQLELQPFVFSEHKIVSLKKKIKPEEVYIQLSQLNGVGNLDSIYFVTKFQKVADEKILLNSVEAKLTPFENNKFGINLIVFQKTDESTLLKLLPIDNSKIKNKRTVLQIKEEGIFLQPTDFYLGYGFSIKDLPTPFLYKLIVTLKGKEGSGALLKIKDGQPIFQNNEFFNYTFPFTISYKKI